jgi:pyridoxal phosphate enzyme (YggS family)
MAELITGLDSARVRANVAEARERIAAAARRAGRNPDAVELLAAVKYVALDEGAALAEAGLTLLGENRAQELEAKAAAWGGAGATGEPFTWDFIGHLQSRKVRQVVPHVRLIHSVASDSVLEQLARHTPQREDFGVLIEVNVAGEASKSGISPGDLAAFVARCAVPVVGLMTMPPLAARAEDNRRHFAALRELAAAHDLRHLSMGTSQDYEVAVEEGATIVRLGSTLYR